MDQSLEVHLLNLRMSPKSPKAINKDFNMKTTQLDVKLVERLRV